MVFEGAEFNGAAFMVNSVSVWEVRAGWLGSRSKRWVPTKESWVWIGRMSPVVPGGFHVSEVFFTDYTQFSVTLVFRRMPKWAIWKRFPRLNMLIWILWANYGTRTMAVSILRSYSAITKFLVISRWKRSMTRRRLATPKSHENSRTNWFWKLRYAFLKFMRLILYLNYFFHFRKHIEKDFVRVNERIMEREPKIWRNVRRVAGKVADVAIASADFVCEHKAEIATGLAGPLVPVWMTVSIFVILVQLCGIFSGLQLIAKHSRGSSAKLAAFYRLWPIGFERNWAKAFSAMSWVCMEMIREVKRGRAVPGRRPLNF